MVAACAGLSLLAAACTSDGDGIGAAFTGDTSTTSTTLSPTTTTVPPTTVATPPPPPPPPPPAPPVPPTGLTAGARGEVVRLLEQRLDALRYDVGTVDDVYDRNTAFAVTAFQKVAGLPRTGKATPDVLNAMAVAQPPPPMVPGGGATRVEIDLGRQVLFLYQGDALHRVLPISSGTGKRYCAEGSCGIATTPTGSFKVERRISGWRKSRLGRLYNPLYFRGGIAIHGYPSVPAQPASHGCVRIPMTAAGWFPAMVPDGTPVYVLARA